MRSLVKKLPGRVAGRYNEVGGDFAGSQLLLTTLLHIWVSKYNTGKKVFK